MAPYLNMSGVTEAAEVGGSDTKALKKIRILNKM